jgi:polyisoprenoid-binding protein YceI
MTAWTLEPAHSDVSFAVKHMGFSTVRGRFGGVAGTVTFAEDGRLAGADITIDVSTIDTGMAQRDGHLKSPDFFDVATYPQARFVATSVAQQPDGALTVAGDLTLHGITRPVTLTGTLGQPAVDPFGQRRVGASLSAALARKDWGLTWNVALEKGGWLVSEDVTLHVDVQAVPAT